MRKADRLFQIIQILRRSSRPVTCAQLAAELEVARRTVYRDIAALIGQRVPIEGEAGFGYVLDARYEMPPLMLTPEEIEAILLGAQMVGTLRDVSMTNAAADVVAKIASAVPGNLRPFIAEPIVGIKPPQITQAPLLDTRQLRSALRDERKLHLEYRSAAGNVSERTVWPLLLGYGQTHCLLIAWCESRQAFRHFRTDRILRFDILPDTIGMRKAKLRKLWQRLRDEEFRRLQ